jgi:hypothetical protein
MHLCSCAPAERVRQWFQRLLLQQDLPLLLVLLLASSCQAFLLLPLPAEPQQAP